MTRANRRIELPAPMFEGYRVPPPKSGDEARSLTRSLKAFNDGDEAWCFYIDCINFPCDELCIYTCTRDPSGAERKRKCAAFADWLVQHGCEVTREGYERKLSANFVVGGARKMEE